MPAPRSTHDAAPSARRTGCGHEEPCRLPRHSLDCASAARSSGPGAGMWGMIPTFFCSRRLPRRDVSDALERVVIAELDALGFELFELRKGGSRSRPVLGVRIDRRDFQPVT